MEREPAPPYPGPPQPGFTYPDYQPPLVSPSQTAQPQVFFHTISAPTFGPESTSTICPSCHAQIETEVQNEATTKTHLFALLLCLFGFYCCCCIPYCVDSCQSQNHYCPNCHAFLGSHEN